MLIQLTIPQWLALSPDVRGELKKIFNIPRSSGTVLEDNRVVTDGYTHPDLANITIEKMQDYLKIGHIPTDEFYGLFTQVLEKIEAEMPAPVVVTAPTTVHAVASQDLFVEHDGKTYKLTEVPPEPQQPLVPALPQVTADSAAPKSTGKAGGRAKANKPASK